MSDTPPPYEAPDIAPGRRNTYVDIDALVEPTELDEGDPIIIRVLGRDWSFPGAIPSAVFSAISRMGQDGRPDLDPQTMFGLVDELIPRRYLRQWSELGLSILNDRQEADPRFAMVVQVLLVEYIDRLPKTQPNRAARRRTK